MSSKFDLTDALLEKTPQDSVGQPIEQEEPKSRRMLSRLSFLLPIAFTLLSFYVRFHNIDKNNYVVWDEAHFGKFGSYYIKHEFYHDVHPPLGKMLIAFTEWLAGFNGDFNFDSNHEYPEHVNFKRIRQYNAVFGALCTPLAYYTAGNMGFSTLTTCFVTLMVTLEHSFCLTPCCYSSH